MSSPNIFTESENAHTVSRMESDAALLRGGAQILIANGQNVICPTIVQQNSTIIEHFRPQLPEFFENTAEGQVISGHLETLRDFDSVIGTKIGAYKAVQHQDDWARDPEEFRDFCNENNFPFDFDVFKGLYDGFDYYDDRYTEPSRWMALHDIWINRIVDTYPSQLRRAAVLIMDQPRFDIGNTMWLPLDATVEKEWAIKTITAQGQFRLKSLSDGAVQDFPLEKLCDA